MGWADVLWGKLQLPPHQEGNAQATHAPHKGCSQPGFLVKLMLDRELTLWPSSAALSLGSQNSRRSKYSHNIAHRVTHEIHA